MIMKNSEVKVAMKISQN